MKLAAPRLLCVDQLHVYVSWVPECLFHGFFGDFVKHHSFGRLGPMVPVGRRLQMPGNCLAFPIRVGGQINLFRLFAGFL